MNAHEQLDRYTRKGGMCHNQHSSSLRVYVKKSRAHVIRTNVKIALRTGNYDAAEFDPGYSGYNA